MLLDMFLNLPRRSKQALSIAADIGFLSFSMIAAFWLRYERIIFVQASELLPVMGMTVAVTVLAFARLGLYRAVIRFMSNHALKAVVIGVGVSVAALIAFGFYFQLLVPRSVPLIYSCLALLFVGGSRMLLRSYVQRHFFKRKERVVIYGAGSTGRQLATSLLQGEEFMPIAFVDDDRRRQNMILMGLHVHAPTRLQHVIDKYGPTRILLALDDHAIGKRREILRLLEDYPIQVQTVPKMSDVISGRARIEELRDIEIEDLLGREPVAPNGAFLTQCIKGKTVMVTGAGGSIGSELCRQIIALSPKKLVLVDISEFSLYQLAAELRAVVERQQDSLELIPIIGSVQRQALMETVMRTFKVQTVYHAAAYKHVPIVEQNVVEGVRNNVFGTWDVAEAAIAAGVENFVLISTDKAVRPTNVMGASKRVAELILQGLAQRQSTTRFCMVRFGNVLGSSGSVVPLFREQIRNGGPVTVTHPDVIRYFMTIPEAAQLVIQAGSMGVGGEVFVLDMGGPVKIVDLAVKMIHLMGYTVRDEMDPDGDIPIIYTGLRPGEKLYEELLIGGDPQPTQHPRIMKAKEVSMPWPKVHILLKELEEACDRFGSAKIRDLLAAAPTGFVPYEEVEDLVWQSAERQSNIVIHPRAMTLD